MYRSCRLLYSQPRQPFEWNYISLLTGSIEDWSEETIIQSYNGFVNKMDPDLPDGILRAELIFIQIKKILNFKNSIYRSVELMNFYKPQSSYWICHFEIWIKICNQRLQKPLSNNFKVNLRNFLRTSLMCFFSLAFFDINPHLTLRVHAINLALG